MSPINQLSVLMCSNNVDAFLVKSLDSIVKQKKVDFELVFVANGPNHEEVAGFVDSYWGSEKKLKLLKTEIPQLAFSLNLGLQACEGEFVVRMDADDIACEDRFYKQLKYIREKKYDIVGSNVFLIDEKGDIIGVRRYPRLHNIAHSIFWKNPICHPSVIFRRVSIIDIGGYNAGFASEDYDLWIRALRQELKIDNIQENLLNYRVHGNSSQGSPYAYAEVAGLLLKTFLLKPSVRAFFAVFMAILKQVLKRK